jgi:formate hydrogenlyase subunit 3/multisubunit Na+/H+ antiporter MnhD subunit
MRARIYVAAAGACLGLTFLVSWLLSWSFERAALLAPVLVAGLGAALGLLILWARVIWESIRERDHPRRIVAYAVGAVVLIAALSVLGVTLPRE